MPVFWGYYHKLIKWPDTFWRLDLKFGFHSQMEQFQNALLVPWHTNKVRSAQLLVARSGRHHSIFNEVRAGTAYTSLPAAPGRGKAATLRHNKPNEKMLVLK